MLISSSTTDSAEEITRALAAIGQEAEVIDTFSNEPEQEQQEKQSDAQEPLTEQDTEDEGKTAEESETSQPQEKKEAKAKPEKAKDGVQKRIDELTRERYERDGRIKALEEQLAKLTEKPADKPKAEEVVAPPPVVETQPAKAKPTAEDLDDRGNPKYEGTHDPQFIEDLSDWKADEREAKLTQHFQELLDQRDQAANVQSEAEAKVLAFRQAAEERVPNWNELAASDAAKDCEFSPAFLDGLMESDFAPEVVAYLIQHPEVAKPLREATLYALDAAPVAVLRANRLAGKELARIESLVQAAAPQTDEKSKPVTPAKSTPKATAAPKPITPVRGAAPTAKASPYEKPMSFKEYDAWRTSGGGKKQ